MTAFIERNPRKGVELYTPGDVGWPYRSQPAMTWAERLIWGCVGVVVGLGCGFVLLVGMAEVMAFAGVIR